MGAWGTDLFDDDLALDIKGDWQDAMEQNMSIEEATELLMQEYDYLQDPDEEDDLVTFYLVLAVLQLEKGRILPNILQQSLTYLTEERGLDRWDGEELTERKKVYQDLRQKLLASQAH